MFKHFIDQIRNHLLPPAGTQFASDVDRLIEFLVSVSLVASLLIIGGFVYFSIVFRRKKEGEQTPRITHHRGLEFLWSFIPFLIFIFIFAWGWLLYSKMRHPLKGALEVYVYAQMWNWDFVYKNGRKSSGVLYVPINRPVKLIMTSRDVIHSFFVPSFRIKQDVVPGTYTSLFFTPNKKGRFHVFCAEFCGTGHSTMLAKVKVMALSEWEHWLATDPYKGMNLVQIGEKVFQGRCTACHKTTSQRMIGPGLASLFKSEREFEKASPEIANEAYIRESILNPSAKVVKSYPNQMTPFAGLLKEEELTGLVEYIKSLKGEK